MTVYLDVDTVIELNLRHCGAGAGVRDVGGLQAAVFRPMSSFGEHEPYPDVWTKAAALLHAIAASQAFSDGNKRTAWLATLTFLELNDIELRYVPAIEAEPFVLAVAVTAFSIEQAAEWLEYQHISNTRMISAMLCEQVTCDDIFDIRGGGFTVRRVPELPCRTPLLAALVFSGEFPGQDTVVTHGRVLNAEGAVVPMVNEEGGNCLSVSHMLKIDKPTPDVEGEPWQRNMWVGYGLEVSQPGRHRLEISFSPSHDEPKVTLSLPFTVAVGDPGVPQAAESVVEVEVQP
ncbi:type II toxin-antitoxin system death-on-curing family toxin [Nocardia goodfellowii]